MSVDWNRRGTTSMLGAGMSKIQMIKEIRQVCGAGLKESKDAVEEAAMSLDDSVPDQEIIAAALHLLDPHRFPLVSTELNYKDMWNELYEHVDGTTAEQMERMKYRYEESTEKLIGKNLIARALRLALSSTFQFSQPGCSSVHLIYDRNGNWVGELAMPREQVKDMIREAFEEWIDTL